MKRYVCYWDCWSFWAEFSRPPGYVYHFDSRLRNPFVLM
jgi:hypothetical protein